MSSDSASPRNEQWIAFLAKARTPEQQADLEFIREHFSAVYQTWGVAMLEMVAKVEEHEAGLRGQYARSVGNQEMIIDHLTRQEGRDTQILTALTNFQAGLDRLGEDVTGIKQAMEERFLALETRMERAERKLASHDESRDASIDERRLLRQDMDASKAHRVALQEGQDRIETDVSALRDEIHHIREVLEEVLTTREATSDDNDG